MSSTRLRVKELLREKGWTTEVLAEKTGMSPSYLTHIKNSTRRWNEDSLKKLAHAFDLDPVELFAQYRQRTDKIDSTVTISESTEMVDLKIQAIPVMTDIPSIPTAYNNQIMQTTSGCKGMFVPIFENNDQAMFALLLNNNQLAPTFEKGDVLIVSPETWTHSGDIAAVEYGNDSSSLSRIIAKITYTDDFTVLEPVNFKQAPVALIRGKDHFRIIGRVIARHQSFL